MAKLSTEKLYVLRLSESEAQTLATVLYIVSVDETKDDIHREACNNIIHLHDALAAAGFKPQADIELDV